MPILFRQGQTSGIDVDLESPERATTSLPCRRSSSSSSSKRGAMGGNRETQVRVGVRREFLRTTAKGTQDEADYTNPETLPSVEAAYSAFQRVYPKFAETRDVDDLRDREYFHLEESQHVCMDYCGFGLFSYYQQIVNEASSSFGLAYISANLPTHALYGAADEGTVEFYIRKRVMDYLNINDADYTMVFTASRGSAFKLLAESYPFHLNPKLLTVYDFESEAVNWMSECAKQKGAKIMSACFKWPSLRIGTSHLKKLLQEKKKKGESAKGLFVFPVQSRMTGAKYSYQWMSEAQQNKWHVLLDASSLGPKDMDSLGLSLFRPDFIVSSFYKVFGIDPTGFGCLFIKNTAIHSLHNSSRARAVGMVRIVSLSNYKTEGTEVKESEEDGGEGDLHERWFGLGQHNGHSEERSFSGPFFTAVEGEKKTKHKAKESNHRAWKSWKRSSKMERHNREHVKNREHSHLRGSNDRMETGTRIGEGDAGEAQFVAQPPAKSRYFSETRATEIEEEQLHRAKETLHVRDRARHPYERSEHDIQEVGDDKVEVWNSRQLSNPEWPLQGRATGIQEECKSVEFHSLGRQGISPIREEDMEDDQEVEERWGSERYSKPSDEAKESGEAHMMFSDRYGAANEIEEDFVDDGRNSTFVSPRFDAEAFDDAGRTESTAIDEWQPGSGLDINDTESEEILEPNVSAERHQHAINEVTNVEEPGESSDHFDDVEKRNELRKSMSDTGSHSSVKKILQFFERRVSFNKHTGKQSSDVQETGVQGLVNKFQSLLTGNTSDKGIDSTVNVTLGFPLDEETQLGQTAGLSPGTSPLSPTGTQEGSQVVATENDSQHKRAGQVDGGFEAVSSNLSTSIYSRTGDTLGVRGTVAENSPEHATSKTDLNMEYLPRRDNAVNGLQHSSSFEGHGRTPYESGEENYITILPGRTGKNWKKSVTENGIVARTSTSPELLDKEATSTSDTGQREFTQTMEDPSSPEEKLRADHAREEKNLFQNSRSSPSIKLDNNLHSISKPVDHHSTDGSSADDISLNIADFHDVKGQGLQNSRFDLRSNRTLWRNVDFVDELYPDRLASRRQSSRLAEDIARLDEEYSDEESPFHSQHYSGSLHGDSTSGYQVDDLQTTSYGEGEDNDTEGEYDDIPESESRESQGEPMISCKGLDFADSLGLTKLNYRLRYLINWLVNSLLKLRHPGPNQGAPLVRIYGPKVRYDRGAAVSFNIFDWKGGLIQPGLVQRLADRSNISLGVGRLCNIIDPDMSPDFMAEKERLLGADKNDKSGVEYSPGAGKVDAVSIPVVTAAMGFVTSFEDVYKLWSFLAKFLDADHVSKEAWRYHSLNQEIMLM